MNTGRQRVEVRRDGDVLGARRDGDGGAGYADILLDVSGASPRREEDGVVQEADDGVDPTRKLMTYVLHLRTRTGRAVTFLGVKDVASPDGRGRRSARR